MNEHVDFSNCVPRAKVPSQLVYDAGGNEPVAPQVATALMEAWTCECNT